MKIYIFFSFSFYSSIILLSSFYFLTFKTKLMHISTTSKVYMRNNTIALWFWLNLQRCLLVNDNFLYSITPQGFSWFLSTLRIWVDQVMVARPWGPVAVTECRMGWIQEGVPPSGHRCHSLSLNWGVNGKIALEIGNLFYFPLT